MPHLQWKSLALLRAAIEVVAGGAASRASVQATAGHQILPAARALAKAAGVTLEPSWWTDEDGCDIVVACRPRATTE